MTTLSTLLGLLITGAVGILSGAPHHRAALRHQPRHRAHAPLRRSKQIHSVVPVPGTVIHVYTSEDT